MWFIFVGKCGVSSSFHGRALAALLALVRGYVVWRRVIIIRAFFLPFCLRDDQQSADNNSRGLFLSRFTIAWNVEIVDNNFFPSIWVAGWVKSGDGLFYRVCHGDYKNRLGNQV